VVQAADFGKLNDFACHGELDWPDVGGVLVQREVGTRLMVIGKVSRRRRSLDTLVVRTVSGGNGGSRGWRSENGCFRQPAPIRGQAGFLDHEETVKGKPLFVREVYRGSRNCRSVGE
jgi:hypothetical protein